MNNLPEHISYSSFSTWQECGWKYKLTKVDQVGEGHAVWFTGGSALHKATEYYDLEGASRKTCGTVLGLNKSKRMKNSTVT